MGLVGGLTKRIERRIVAVEPRVDLSTGDEAEASSTCSMPAATSWLVRANEMTTFRARSERRASWSRSG
jgi:hypothetical protein